MGEKLAGWLYGRMEGMKRKPSHILYNSVVREDLRILEPAGNTEKRQKEYVIKKLSLCSMIVLAGVVLSLLLWVKEGMDTEIADNRLYRNAYGYGAKKVDLVAVSDEETFDISLEIEEKTYTQEELNKLAEEFIPLLEHAALGNNASFDEVCYGLNLVEGIAGFPFAVEWQTDEAYVGYEGALVQDNLEKPQLVELTAVVSCENFELRHVLNCMVYAKADADPAQWVQSRLKESEKNSRSHEFLALPSKIEEQAFRWSYKRSYNGLLFLAATPILALALYYGKDKDLHKQVEDREEQMRLDYPEIVSSLALLIGAGMTVPNAWNKVARDYQDKKKETGKKRYAYEEMLLAIYETENGVSQTKAYEHFGRRSRIPSYNKLAAMLSQNVRKGATNLAALLREEAAEAFEERKHIARKLGEKAGTKLLAPMMLLLGMIMVIIMIPAFATYF